MLDEVGGRPNTKQLMVKAQNILRDAEKKLKAVKVDYPELDVQSQRRAPPAVPPGFPHSQSDQTEWNSTPGRWLSARRNEGRRSATINVLARESTPSPEKMAHDGYESPDEISYSTLTSPTSPPNPNVDSRNQYQNASGHSSTYQSTSPTQQSQKDVLAENHSPTPHSKNRRFTSNRGSDQLQHASLLGPFLGPPIRNSNDTSSEGSGAAELASQPVDSDPVQPEFVQKRMATMSISSSPAKQHATRQMPYTSVVEFENWMLKKKQQRGSTYHNLEHKELLDEMYERDHVGHVSYSTDISYLTHLGIPCRRCCVNVTVLEQRDHRSPSFGIPA